MLLDCKQRVCLAKSSLGEVCVVSRLLDTVSLIVDATATKHRATRTAVSRALLSLKLDAEP